MYDNENSLSDLADVHTELSVPPVLDLAISSYRSHLSGVLRSTQQYLLSQVAHCWSPAATMQCLILLDISRVFLTK